MKAVLFTLAILFAGFWSVAQACNAPEGAEPDVQLPTSSGNPVPANVTLYVHATGSMQGYFNLPLSVVNPYRQAIAEFRENVALLWSGANVGVYRFGTTIDALTPDQESLLLLPSYYGCGHRNTSTPCDVAHTRLDQVFDRIAQAPNADVSVVYTDLFQSDPSLGAITASALFMPMKAILKSGKSIAIIGFRARFNGTVYDIPDFGTGNPSQVRFPAKAGIGYRPVFLLFFGDAREVQALAAQIATIIDPNAVPNWNAGQPGDVLRFAFFPSGGEQPVGVPKGQDLGSLTTPPQTFTGGFQIGHDYTLPDVTGWIVTVSRAQNVLIPSDIGARLAAFTPIGMSLAKPTLSYRLWMAYDSGNCEAWEEKNPLLSPALVDLHNNDDGSYSVVLFESGTGTPGAALTQLPTGQTYFVNYQIISPGESVASQTDWSDWSLDQTNFPQAGQDNGKLFKTLYLSEIFDQLQSQVDQSLQAITKPVVIGRAWFILKLQ